MRLSSSDRIHRLKIKHKIDRAVEYFSSNYTHLINILSVLYYTINSQILKFSWRTYNIDKKFSKMYITREERSNDTNY
jgi:hypothetical protein